MPGMAQSDHSRPQRAKTSLACDTCRARKSRCDGLRPSCTHCTSYGLICIYRPSQIFSEPNQTLVTRLNDFESRLATLESSLGNSNGMIASPNSHVSNHSSTRTQHAQIPILHTAGAHKIFQYWPRIRINISLPGIVPLQYLGQADHKDTSLMDDTNIPQVCDLSVLISCISNVCSRSSELPLPLHALLSSPWPLPTNQIIQTLQLEQQASPIIGGRRVFLKQRSIYELLLFSISRAFFSSEMDDDGLPDAQAVFQIALEKMWTLSTATDEHMLWVRLCTAYILVYVFARPFHAIGELRQAGNLAKQLSQESHTSNFRTEFELLHKLSYLLESDILSEIDGQPVVKLDPVPSALREPQSDPSIPEDTTLFFLDASIRLRSCLNKIFGSLYTTNEAYCHPHDVGSLISQISDELEQWYRSLPLSTQFNRSVDSYVVSPPDESLRRIEMALRYHSCVFLLHRPSLYFFLHEGLEHATTPPDARAMERPLDPWVFESCRSCIQSAMLIIYILRQRLRSFPAARCTNWCDMQMVVATACTLMQSRSKDSLASLLNGAVDELLDVSESILLATPFGSVGMTATLEILRNVRQNLLASTPIS